MLTRNERIIVEAIRNAPSVTIVIPGDGMTGDTRIKIANKKVSHDVALAVQSHFVNHSKRGGGIILRIRKLFDMKCVVKKTGAVGEIIGTIRDEGTEKVVFTNGLIIPSKDVLPVFPPIFDNGGLAKVKADAFETARHLGVVPFLDGDSWCALYGPNIQEGICGFGDSPESAILKFYDEFVGRNKE